MPGAFRGVTAFNSFIVGAKRVARKEREGMAQL